MIEASKLRAGMTFVAADGKLIRVLEATINQVRVIPLCG